MEQAETNIEIKSITIAATKDPKKILTVVVNHSKLGVLVLEGHACRPAVEAILQCAGENIAEFEHLLDKHNGELSNIQSATRLA